jgi:membrane-associated phospholipid phosphatase
VIAGRRLALAAVLIAVVSPAAARAQPASAPPTLAAIGREIPSDLWRFISWDTAIVLGIGGGAALVAHTWDDDLADEVETNVSLNNALEPGHTYGAFAFQALVGVGIYAAGRIGTHTGLATTGADIMRAQILSQVYVQALKFSVGRERPDGSNTQSFPSGHSASAFATAAVLQRRYGWKVGVPAMLLATYVATAQVHDNKHYLSDVVFGATMGFAGERTVSLNAGRYGVTLVPSASRGRVALVALVTAP